MKCVSVREEESKSRRRSRILHTQINQELCLAEKFGGESRKKKKSQVSSALGDDCMNLLKTLSKGIYSCNVAF